MPKSAKKSSTKKSSKSTVSKYRSKTYGPELKWTDSTVAPAVLPFGLATAFQTLNLVNQGTGPNERIGRTIVVKQIEIKINMQGLWQIAATQVAVLSNVSYRVDLFLDKQANGALPAAADIYDTLIAGVAPENRFPNLLNSDRFVLMKRWEGDLNPPSFTTTQAAANAQVAIGRDLKLAKKCNVRIELSPQPIGPTTIANVRSNNLFLVYSQSLGQTGSTGVNVVSTADTRILFQDA